MRIIVAVLLAACLSFATAASARAQDLLVFAAASLKTALDEINAARPSGSPGVRVSYAATPALARQIEAGAPADIFISADLDWMDYLQQRRLLRPGTRDHLLGNRIVLVAPADSPAAARLAPGLDLPALLGRDGRLAMADVAAVSAGKYGRAALESLGLWAGVAARVAMAENVRAALVLVARGEAPLGIVYATDAAAEPCVRVLDAFPAASHPPIIYPAALTAAAAHPQAAAWLAALRGAAARQVFERHGFAVLPRQAAMN